VPQGQGSSGVDLIITQDATSMTVEYPKPPAKGKLTYKLDGSVSKNTLAGGRAPTGPVSKAIWAGNKLVVTTTTGAGEEKRTFSIEEGNLVVETSASRNVTKVTYQQYERGHGG
jgi:hypothetical protein